MKTNQSRAQHVASLLRASGFKVESVTEGDQCTDASVQLTDSVHVQVPDYAAPGVVETLADGKILFHPERRKLSDLLSDLRRAKVIQERA